MKINPNHTSRRLVTKLQLASHINVCTRTITNLQQSRTIPCIKFGRNVRFDPIDCIEALKHNNQINHIDYNPATKQHQGEKHS
jgi:hypothetical protein